MGYMRHHAIIVSSWDKDLIAKAFSRARKLFGAQVTELSPEATNGYRSFLVPPDGSKEGWDESDLGDARRTALKRFLVSKAYEDGSTSLRWIEVQFADDCGIERIVNSDILHEALAPPPSEEKP